MTTRYLETVDDLRPLYDLPSARAVGKQLAAIDAHCKRFVELSPFVVLSTTDADHCDASPRGGQAGFVRVVDERTLWIPDSPGNNRLDSLINILKSGRIGLLFLIPGVDETLRVNGRARLTVDPEVLRVFTTGTRACKVVIEVDVEEAFLHCAKALMRSRLWAEDSRVDRSVLPSMGQMLADQIGTSAPVESQEEMVRRYRRDL
jgi:PPOX class probable FMN-dependent enzyme